MSLPFQMIGISINLVLSLQLIMHSLRLLASFLSYQTMDFTPVSLTGLRDKLRVLLRMTLFKACKDVY